MSFDIWNGDSSEAPVGKAKAVFAQAGLTARDIAALLCAHGEIKRILLEKAANMEGNGDDNDEEKILKARILFPLVLVGGI